MSDELQSTSQESAMGESVRHSTESGRYSWLFAREFAAATLLVSATLVSAIYLFLADQNALALSALAVSALVATTAGTLWYLRRPHEKSASLLPSAWSRKHTERLRTLERQFGSRDLAGTTTVQTEDLDDVVVRLGERLERTLAPVLLEEMEAKYSTSLRKTQEHALIESDFAAITSRLREEVIALGKRANVNLAIGVSTTLVAVGMLGYIAWFSTESQDIPSLDVLTRVGETMVLFLPRLSLVVFIEVFAFFFLRLYKSTLAEIKFFQNELTNVEAQKVALRAVLLNDSEQLYAAVIPVIARTERNFVLEKGQTTVQLKQAELDRKNLDTETERRGRSSR